MRRWALLFLLLLLPFGVLFAAINALPDVDILKTHYPQLRYRLREDGSVHVDVRFQRSRPEGWVNLESIPGWVQGAVVTSEDWAFFSHSGFDFNQIREALEERAEGRRLRGASTLSQQLVKNVFLAHDRTWGRKISEAWLTQRLEQTLPKRKILEIYLNVVEWGRDVVGIRQAARHYFGKTPSALDPREAAYLAHLLPNPRRYARGFYSGGLSTFSYRQVQRNLDRMRPAGYITDVQWQTFKSRRLPFETTDHSGSEIPEGQEIPEDVEYPSSEETFSPSETSPLAPPVFEPGVSSEDEAEPTHSEPPPTLVPPESVDEEPPLDLEVPSSL